MNLDAARAHLAVALDVPTLDEARELAHLVVPFARVLKVGLELFVAHGPAAVRAVSDLECDVFLDLKLHDIPETVARSVASAAQHGVRYLTLHAGGGPRMLAAAARAAHNTKLQLLAVTVLTSLDAGELAATGVASAPAEQADRLAHLAREAGLRGLVTSPEEAPRLRAALGPEALLVTPGIRPSGASAGDQRRIATPAAAIRGGADLLVVGRPIRDAASPADAARAIRDEIAAALA
ncbi:MAG: orotidine-5'-phosphate decarboxylase [Polyangiaceae bacterium]